MTSTKKQRKGSGRSKRPEPFVVQPGAMKVKRVRYQGDDYFVAGSRLIQQMERQDPDLRFLSYSQAGNYKRCRYRWDLYHRRLIRKRIDSRSRSVGSGVHEGMAAGILTGGDLQMVNTAIQTWGAKWISDLVPQPTDEEMAQIKEVAQTSLDIAVREVKALDFDRYETVYVAFPDGDWPMVEMNCVVQVPEDWEWDGFRFYIDWAMRDRETGHIWIVDHKVREAFVQLEDEEMNSQAALYMGGASFFGCMTHGTATYQIRRGVPKLPSRNKSTKPGTKVSRAKIATDWPTYRQALLDAGEDPAEYAEMEEKCGEYEWRRWNWVPRSKREVKGHWLDLQITGWRMADSLDHDPEEEDRDYGYNDRAAHIFECRGCWARAFCIAELREDDTDILLETDFQDLNREPVDYGGMDFELIPDDID